MRYLSLFIVLTIATIVNAQVGDYSNDTLINYTDINGKKQGKWVKKYDDGQIRYKGFFVNDIPTGTFYYYFGDGALKSLLDYNDKGCANVEFYHENGEQAASGKYNENRERIGLWTMYFKDGSKSAKIMYEHNKASGPVEIYYPSGNKLLDCVYSDGQLNGDYKRYFQNGAQQEIGTYKNGMRHGYFKFYNPSNNFTEVGTYYKGDKHGAWINYEALPGPDTVEYTFGIPENWKELDQQFRDTIEWAKHNQDKFKQPQDYIDNPFDFFKP